MTVKELKEILNKFDDNQMICVEYTDHTDYRYVCEISEESVQEDITYVSEEITEELGVSNDVNRDGELNIISIKLEEQKAINC